MKLGFGESVFALTDTRTPSALALPGYAESADEFNLLDGGLSIDISALSIRVEEREFSISENGGPFVYGAYTLIFSRQGVFEDVAYTRSIDDIAPSLRGKTVVIVERPELSAPFNYQVGRWGRESLFKGELDPAQPLSIDRASLRSRFE